VARPQAPRLIGDHTVTAQDHSERRLTFDQPVLIDQLLRAHRRGPGDPTHRRLGPGHWLRASLTPEGPVLLRLAGVGTTVSARAWGEGADWALDQLPRLLGTDDDPTGFVPRPEHAALVLAHRRYAEIRVGRSELVWEALAPACLEQVVTGKEAFRAFRLLVTEFGELAPGPAADPESAAYGMRVPPPAAGWARIPTWRFLAAGVEQRRSATLVRAAGRATALERTLAGENVAADRALRSLPGIGPWTSAEVRQRAHGDPDAWSIHDYHVAKDITYALVGEPLDDAACLEILEPYRGHRYRVQLLLSLSAARRPRRAPRMTLPTHTPYATKGRS
jgi:3-methyladenine DNA glycosylase/8-oxoguanine DNA glycosylase